MLDNKKEIKAFLPGTIIDVLVQEGQEVQPNQTLVVLEAMKMHNRMVSAINGKIKSINVKVGDRVPKNCVMVELE
ncbi:MAG: hypothetical protein IJU72_07520 [Bacteroidales bacterium]|nr:hypothetical protein [Bacteroidales bacterium]